MVIQGKVISRIIITDQSNEVLAAITDDNIVEKNGISVILDETE
jgi:hypothetical protein